MLSAARGHFDVIVSSLRAQQALAGASPPKKAKH